MLHFRTPVDDCFFPRLGLRLDAFAVPEPADIRKVRGQQVKFGFHFPWPRHPRLVYESQSHAVLAKQSGKARVQPVFVSNLDSIFVILRELLQKRSEPCEKVLSVLESRFIEIAKLKEQRPKLFAQRVHRLQKMLQVLFAVHQNFFVCDHLRHFCRENKARWRFRVPTLHCREGRSSIEGAVHLNRIELRRVIAEIVGGLHAGGIEASFPPRGRERRGAHPDLRVFCHRRTNSTPESLLAYTQGCARHRAAAPAMPAFSPYFASTIGISANLRFTHQFGSWS